MTKHPKQHRTIPPVAVPLLLALCLVCAFCFVRPITANARDSAVITRVREYYPKDAVLPDTEVYYPQISFGENPSQLQTANAMMREYAIGQYVLFEFAMHERQYRDYKSGVAKERFQKELESFGCKVPSLDNEICAAIAMALDEHMNDSAHDMESYVITIKR